METVSVTIREGKTVASPGVLQHRIQNLWLLVTTDSICPAVHQQKRLVQAVKVKR
jgi:hypothetical protein